ncbi:MAG: heavy metal translocating P-type ATPase, partial [Eubacterium sp.]
KTLIRIIIGAVIFGVGYAVPETGYWKLTVYLVAYLVVGGDVVLKAIQNIFRGRIFDENFLMGLATIGAFLIGQYPEGVAVMLFYQVGELFQSYAVNKSRKSITELMDIRQDYANIEQEGKLIQVNPDDVEIGTVIVVKAGEKIPLDGKVIDGKSMVDTSALTGESVPRELETGSEALSGCINLNGVLRIQVTKEFDDSTVSKILELVENASTKKAKTEQFITRFARYYTPAVVIAATVLAIVPPLVLPGAVFSDWLQRALIFLVISCPCALVISVPLSFFGGIGGASKCGILVKGSNFLEALSHAETIVFDKTGTLTKGVFKVTDIHAIGVSESVLLETAALAESYSDHPISLSLKKAYGKTIDNERITGAKEISGYGIVAVVDGKKINAGNRKLMEQLNINCEYNNIGTVVHVAIDGIYAGYIVISDEVKEDAAKAIKDLHTAGVKRTVMLTGDNHRVGEKVGAELGINTVYAELLPGDKVDKMENLMAEKAGKSKLAFVGDGINDAPVLMRADIGIAMGAMGSDAAIEAADIVIMDDKPSKIATAMKISRKTLKIVKQNIIFALGVKAIVLIIGALGFANMWEAVFADVGVSVIAILNATRALSIKDYQNEIEK